MSESLKLITIVGNYKITGLPADWEYISDNDVLILRYNSYSYQMVLDNDGDVDSLNGRAFSSSFEAETFDDYDIDIIAKINVNIPLPFTEEDKIPDVDISCPPTTPCPNGCIRIYPDCDICVNVLTGEICSTEVPDQMGGCLDPSATNYDPGVDFDDGSCEYDDDGEGEEGVIPYPLIMFTEIHPSTNVNTDTGEKYVGEWVELYNPGLNPVDLTGYRFVGTNDEPQKYINFEICSEDKPLLGECGEVGNGCTLRPGEFLVLYERGKEDSYDYDDYNDQTEAFHQNVTCYQEGFNDEFQPANLNNCNGNDNEVLEGSPDCSHIDGDNDTLAIFDGDPTGNNGQWNGSDTSPHANLINIFSFNNLYHDGTTSSSLINPSCINYGSHYGSQGQNNWSRTELEDRTPGYGDNKFNTNDPLDCPYGSWSDSNDDSEIEPPIGEDESYCNCQPNGTNCYRPGYFNADVDNVDGEDYANDLSYVTEVGGTRQCIIEDIKNRDCGEDNYDCAIKIRCSDESSPFTMNDVGVEVDVSLSSLALNNGAEEGFTDISGRWYICNDGSDTDDDDGEDFNLCCHPESPIDGTQCASVCNNPTNRIINTEFSFPGSDNLSEMDETDDVVVYNDFFIETQIVLRYTGLIQAQNILDGVIDLENVEFIYETTENIGCTDSMSTDGSFDDSNLEGVVTTECDFNLLNQCVDYLNACKSCDDVGCFNQCASCGTDNEWICFVDVNATIDDVYQSSTNTSSKFYNPNNNALGPSNLSKFEETDFSNCVYPEKPVEIGFIKPNNTDRVFDNPFNKDLSYDFSIDGDWDSKPPIALEIYVDPDYSIDAFTFTVDKILFSSTIPITKLNQETYTNIIYSIQPNPNGSTTISAELGESITDKTLSIYFQNDNNVGTYDDIIQLRNCLINVEFLNQGIPLEIVNYDKSCIEINKYINQDFANNDYELPIEVEQFPAQIPQADDSIPDTRLIKLKNLGGKSYSQTLNLHRGENIVSFWNIDTWYNGFLDNTFPALFPFEAFPWIDRFEDRCGGFFHSLNNNDSSAIQWDTFYNLEDGSEVVNVNPINQNTLCNHKVSSFWYGGDARTIENGRTTSGFQDFNNGLYGGRIYAGTSYSITICQENLFDDNNKPKIEYNGVCFEQTETTLENPNICESGYLVDEPPIEIYLESDSLEQVVGQVAIVFVDIGYMSVAEYPFTDVNDFTTYGPEYYLVTQACAEIFGGSLDDYENTIDVIEEITDPDIGDIKVYNCISTSSSELLNYWCPGELIKDFEITIDENTLQNNITTYDLPTNIDALVVNGTGTGKIPTNFLSYTTNDINLWYNNDGETVIGSGFTCGGTQDASNLLPENHPYYNSNPSSCSDLPWNKCGFTGGDCERIYNNDLGYLALYEPYWSGFGLILNNPSQGTFETSAGNNYSLKTGLLPQCKEDLYEPISTILAYRDIPLSTINENSFFGGVNETYGAFGYFEGVRSEDYSIIEYETELMTQSDNDNDGVKDTWLGTLTQQQIGQGYNNRLFKETSDEWIVDFEPIIEFDVGEYIGKWINEGYDDCGVCSGPARFHIVNSDIDDNGNCCLYPHEKQYWYEELINTDLDFGQGVGRSWYNKKLLCNNNDVPFIDNDGRKYYLETTDCLENEIEDCSGKCFTDKNNPYFSINDKFGNCCYRGNIDICGLCNGGGDICSENSLPGYFGQEVPYEPFSEISFVDNSLQIFHQGDYGLDEPYVSKNFGQLEIQFNVPFSIKALEVRFKGVKIYGAELYFNEQIFEGVQTPISTNQNNETTIVISSPLPASFIPSQSTPYKLVAYYEDVLESDIEENNNPIPGVLFNFYKVYYVNASENEFPIVDQPFAEINTIYGCIDALSANYGNPCEYYPNYCNLPANECVYLTNVDCSGEICDINNTQCPVFDGNWFDYLSPNLNAFINKCEVCVDGTDGSLIYDEYLIGENIVPVEIGQDCAGVCFGSSYVNSCGICVDGTIENSYTEYETQQETIEGQPPITFNYLVEFGQDCNGDCFGQAQINSCGICIGGNTGIPFNNDYGKDCHGDCFGNSFIDDCGICSEGNTGLEANADMDCRGDIGDLDNDGIVDSCFGDHELDECGDCYAPNQSPGVPYWFFDQDGDGIVNCDLQGSNTSPYIQSCDSPNGWIQCVINNGICVENLSCSLTEDDSCPEDTEYDECGICGGDNHCFGCTDPEALNYDEDATINDGTCFYQEGTIIQYPDIYIQGGVDTSDFLSLALAKDIVSYPFEDSFYNLSLEEFGQLMIEKFSGEFTFGDIIIFWYNQTQIGSLFYDGEIWSQSLGEMFTSEHKGLALLLYFNNGGIINWNGE